MSKVRTGDQLGHEQSERRGLFSDDDEVADDTAGKPIEYGRHLYRASRYSFELTLVER